MKRLEALLYKGSCWAVFAVIVWMLGSLGRCYYGGLVTVALIVCLKLVLGLECGVKVKKVAADHPWLLFAVTVAFAILIRMLAASFCKWYFSDGITTQVSDFGLLHKEASEIAKGHWVHSKSWVTVLLYGGVFKLLGNGVRVGFVTSFCFQMITAFCGFILLKRWYNALTAACFSLLFLCAPLVIFHNQNVATEHVYIMLVMISLLTMFSLIEKASFVKRAMLGLALGVLIWACVWTRGEGLLLWVACPAWILLSAIFEKDWRRCVVLPILAVVFAAGAVFAMDFNEKQIGNRIVTCNNTKYWNMLYGANFWEKGRWNTADRALMWERYLSDHPDCDWELKPTDPAVGIYDVSPKCFGGGVPTEVVPYMIVETRRRWQEMSWRRKIRHALIKWQVWRQEWCPNFACREYTRVGLLNLTSAIYIGAMCWLSVLLFFTMCKGGNNSDWGVLIVALIMVGHMMLHAIVEVQPRYTYIVHLSLPMLVSVWAYRGPLAHSDKLR